MARKTGTAGLMMKLTVLVTALAAVVALSRGCTKPALGQINPAVRPAAKKIVEAQKGGAREVKRITDKVKAVEKKLSRALDHLENRRNAEAKASIEGAAPFLEELDALGVDTRSLRNKLSQVEASI